MFTLNYILTFFAGEERLSVKKDETFETLKEAQERADVLDLRYEQHGDYVVGRFTINGEKFTAITDRAFEEYYRECEADTAINLAKGSSPE